MKPQQQAGNRTREAGVHFDLIEPFFLSQELSQRVGTLLPICIEWTRLKFGKRLSIDNALSNRCPMRVYLFFAGRQKWEKKKKRKT